MKLYDLTTLCEEATEEKCQNPFTLPVAVLLYKCVQGLSVTYCTFCTNAENVLWPGAVITHPVLWVALKYTGLNLRCIRRSFFFFLVDAILSGEL